MLRAAEASPVGTPRRHAADDCRAPSLSIASRGRTMNSPLAISCPVDLQGLLTVPATRFFRAAFACFASRLSIELPWSSRDRRVRVLPYAALRFALCAPDQRAVSRRPGSD